MPASEACDRLRAQEYHSIGARASRRFRWSNRPCPGPLPARVPAGQPVPFRVTARPHIAGALLEVRFDNEPLEILRVNIWASPGRHCIKTRAFPWPRLFVARKCGNSPPLRPARGQIARRNLVQDAKLHLGKLSPRLRYVICLIRKFASKGVHHHRLGMRDLIIFSREAETAFRNDS